MVIPVLDLSFIEDQAVTEVRAWPMMNTMERTLATVTENGQLILPASVLDALEFSPGTEVEILVQDGQLELKVPRKFLSEEELKKSLAELQAMFAGGPSLEDELYQMRREEEEHQRRKFGW